MPSKLAALTHLWHCKFAMIDLILHVLPALLHQGDGRIVGACRPDVQIQEHVLKRR